MPVNYPEALRLLGAAAEQGIPRAIFHLGRMHADGLATRQDLRRAVRLYETAAAQGEFMAQIALGRLYSEGRQTPVDHEAARKWYSAAVLQAGRVDADAELDEARTYLARHSER